MPVSRYLLPLFSLFFSFFLSTINANYVPSTTPTVRPTVLMGTAFILDSHPKSLQGSVVTSVDGTLTYRLSCPTGTSPENIACQKENRYPALATHSAGSVLAGAFTTASPGITTRWDCALGSGSGDTIPDQYGVCNRTVIDGTRTSITSTAMNSCYVVQHQVPITFTGGLEFLEVDAFGLQDRESLASAMDQDVSQACKGSTLNPSATETTKGSVTTTSNSSARQPMVSSTFSSTGSMLRTTSSVTAPTNPTNKNGAFQLKMLL